MGILVTRGCFLIDLPPLVTSSLSLMPSDFQALGASQNHFLFFNGMILFFIS